MALAHRLRVRNRRMRCEIYWWEMLNVSDAEIPFSRIPIGVWQRHSSHHQCDDFEVNLSLAIVHILDLHQFFSAYLPGIDVEWRRRCKWVQFTRWWSRVEDVRYRMGLVTAPIAKKKIIAGAWLISNGQRSREDRGPAEVKISISPQDLCIGGSEKEISIQISIRSSINCPGTHGDGGKMCKNALHTHTLRLLIASSMPIYWQLHISRREWVASAQAAVKCIERKCMSAGLFPVDGVVPAKMQISIRKMPNAQYEHTKCEK